jgi:hypothetical protein
VPAVDAWPDYQPQRHKIADDFKDARGVGLLTGIRSGGLIDLDLDDARARLLAAEILPRTDLRHGRAGAPGSHFWYVANPVPKTQQFVDPVDGAMLVELRSSGAQTLVPPTRHPTGETLVWERDGEPARIGPHDLAARAARLAAASLCAKYWPARGSRHHAALALAGILIRGGWPVDDAARFVSRVAWAAGDEEWEERSRDVLTTAQKLESGDHATGGPTLAQLMPEVVVRKAAEWLGVPWARPSTAAKGDSANSAKCAEGWELPVEFTAEVQGPPIPIDRFPSQIADHVVSAAEVHQFPVDLMAGVALGTLAAAAAGRAEVQIGETHFEQLNLYVAAVAASGERKKPALCEGVFPLEGHEKQLLEERAPEIRQKAEEHAIGKQRIEQLRKCAAGKTDPAERTRLAGEIAEIESSLPHVPPTPRLLLDDATPEVVAKVLAEQAGTIAIVSEEAGNLIKVIQGRYSKDGGPDLDVFLKGYDGGTIRVDRITRESHVIAKPALTVVVTPQPALLDRIGEDEELRGRGLLARFCWIFPESRVGTRFYANSAINAEARATYSDVIRSILKLPANSGCTPPRILLAGEALDLWADHADRVEIEQREGGRLSGIRDWASKQPGRVARIAGLFHLVRHHKNSTPWRVPISRDDVAAASTIGMWLEEHALAAFGRIGGDPIIRQAKWILDWIRRHRLERFTLKQLHDHRRDVNRAEAFVPPPRAAGISALHS